MGNLLDSLFPAGSVVDRFHDAPVGNSSTTLFPRQTISALPAEDPRGNWEKLNDYLAATPSPYATKQILRDMLKGVIAGPLALEKTHRGRYNNPFDPQLTADLTPLSLPLGGNALFAKPAPVLSAIRAYHGSPHLFDKFSMKNVGTGEGAQAYGHGLYFAENEGVARSYRDALSNFRTGPEAAKAYLDAAGGDVAQAIVKMRDHAVNGGVGASAAEMQAIRQGLALLQKGGDLSALKSPGSMYEVSLRTEPERLLDWDKPLSAQPKEVKEALFGPTGVVPEFRARRSVREYLEPHVNDDFEGLTGNQFHGVLNRLAQSDLLPTNGPGVMQALERGQTKPAAAAFLRNEGVDGIQYLDAGSRRVGEGSRNYVMFDDKLIDVLRRYGLGGAAVGAGNALIPGEQ